MTKIVFLTAGELPAAKGLIASQVFSLIYELKKSDYPVLYIGVLPLLSYLKDRILKSGRLSGFNQLLKKNNIEHRFIISTLRMAGRCSFFVKKWTSRRIARKIARYLDPDTDYIFHCRSYYAAFIANILKKGRILESSGRKTGGNIRVVFDMRSLLSMEFPFAFGMSGVLMYGLAKKWEHELLINSDLSLMSENNAIKLLKLEHGGNINLEYIPNIGLKDCYDRNFNISHRWKEKKIGYIGGIGGWHPPQPIRLFLDFFESVFAEYERVVLSQDTAFKEYFPGATFRSVDYDDTAGYYNQLIGLVIPGNIFETEDLFRLMKMRLSFFSTKAAEALSKGVPLVVSERIEELAGFVREHGCGIVMGYDESMNRVVPVDYAVKELQSYEFWDTISRNAYEAGRNFTHDAVISLYKKYWDSLG